MSRPHRKTEAIGADLRASEHVVQLRRRRRGPDAPWAWRARCSVCGELGGDWTKAEQQATELGFAHALEHAAGYQLVLELELPQGRISRRELVPDPGRRR